MTSSRYNKDIKGSEDEGLRIPGTDEKMPHKNGFLFSAYQIAPVDKTKNTRGVDLITVPANTYPFSGSSKLHQASFMPTYQLLPFYGQIYLGESAFTLRNNG